MRREPYLVITLITAIPYAILWAFLGTKGLGLIGEQIPSAFDPLTWAISVIIIIALLWWISRKLFVPEENPN